MKKAWNQTLAVLLAVMMLISTIPMGVFAENGSADDTGIKLQAKAAETKQTDLFTYTLGRNGAYIMRCDASASGTVQIPAKLGGRFVYSIASDAFSNCPQISAISLEAGNRSFLVNDGVLYNQRGNQLIYYPPKKPEKTFSVPQSVTSISYGAFRNAVELEKVTMSGVQDISSYAFEGCTALKDIQFGNQLRYISGNVFRGCTSLSAIVLPDSLTSFSSSIFSGCTNLRSITFPANLDQMIDRYGLEDTAFFRDEANWEDGALYIANSLVAIQDSVSGTLRIKPGTEYVTLSQSAAVTALEIPASVHNISAYSIPSTLRTIHVDEDNARYMSDENGILYDKRGAYTRDGEDDRKTLAVFPPASTLNRVAVPEGVKVIGASAFNNCKNIKTVNFPTSLDIIESSAFAGCTSLTSITLPTGLKTLGSGVFRDCTALRSIQLPNALENIGANILQASAFFETASNWTNDLLYCGQYLLAARKTVSGSIQIREDTKVIASGAFSNCSNLKSVTIPQSVTKLPDSLFYQCTSLQSANIPATTRQIGSQCFMDCYQLRQITIPEGVESLGSNCFCNTGLTQITIPASVKTTEYGALSVCDALQTVSFAEGTQKIPYNMLMNCYAREVRIPSSVREIENGVFSNMEKLEKITVADGNTSFLTDSFGALYSKDMTRLLAVPVNSSSKRFTLPKAVRQSEYGIFRGYIGIEEFAFEEGTISPAYIDLNGNYSVHTVFIPAQTTSISSACNGGGVERFVVDSNNMRYKSGEDGVLYSKDGYSLCAYPAAKESASFTIPKEVSYTEYNAFSNNAYLKTLVVENGAYRMPEIRNMPFLQELQIPESVYSFGSISDCPNLTKVKIDSNNRYFKTETDGNVYSKDGRELVRCLPANTGEVFTLPATTTRIGYDAFANCDKLKTVILHDQLTEISSSAFWLCTALESITVPNNVTEIQYSTFYGCTALKTVTIGASVRRINGLAFSRCTSLESIIISTDNKYFTSDASGLLLDSGRTVLIKCPPMAAVDTYTVPSTVTEISEGAFESCTVLRSINLPEGLRSIGSRAFENCTSLQSIQIPESVVTIEGSAFYGCTALNEIALPQSGTNISSGAFNNTAFYNDAANWDGSLLYAQAYLLAAKSENIANSVTVRAGTKYISGGVFNSSSLESVTLPDGLLMIGESAFGWCRNLTTLTLPDSVTCIDNAFYGCTALQSVHLSANLRSMNSAFSQCTSLKSVTIPASVTEMQSAFSSVETVAFADGTTMIPPKAFRWSETLRSVTLPESLTEIGEEAFYYCTALQTIILPKNVTAIGKSAFYNCTALQSIDLSDDLEQIGVQAFYECSALQTVVIPNGVTKIERSTFADCTALQSVTFSDGLTQIDSDAFNNCKELLSVMLPDGLQRIESYAFRSCEKLEEVLLGTTVQFIGYSAFENCRALKSVVIPRSVTSVGNRAFGYVDGSVDAEYLIYCYPSTKGAKYAIDNGIRYEYIELLKPVLEVQAVAGGKAYTSGSFTNQNVKITVTNTEPKAGEIVYYYSTDSGKTVTQFDGILELTTEESNDYVFTAANVDGVFCEQPQTLSVRLDKTVPSGEIRISDGTWSEKWTGFVETESVGHYTENKVSVSIQGEDASGAVLNSGVQSVGYRKSATPLTLSALNSNYGWTNGNTFSVDQEGTFYIYARIVDKAGNVTILGGNDAQDGIIIDRTAPNLSVSYAANDQWTNYVQIQGTVTDLSGVTSLTYTMNDGSAKNLSAADTAFSIPDDVFADGSYTVRITAKDRLGHTSTKTVKVKKDTKAPQISQVQYPKNNGWIPSAQVVVIASDVHSGIQKYSFDGGKTWTDENKRTYTKDAQIEPGSIMVHDNAGNTCAYDAQIQLTKIDSESPVLKSVVYTPVTKTTGAVTMTVSGTDAISGIADNGYSFDGGATWQAAGERLYYQNEVISAGTVMIRDKAGNTAAWDKPITIDNIVDYNLQVRIVDEVGRPVSGAAVYCGLGSASPVTALSDGDGYVRYMVTEGKYAVGAIKDGYLPNVLETSVKGTDVAEVTVVIGKQELVEGTVDVHRMTLQEILDAGIDVNDPENQYICEATLHFVYQKREYTDTVYTYGGGSGSGGFSIGGGGGFGGGFGGGSGSGLWYYVIVPIGHPDQSFLVILDVPVRASILKEFFAVNVQLVNNASAAINIRDNKLKLNVPDGLTIMNAEGYQNATTIEFDTFAGQETKTFSWILRGDSVGEYEISADYEGVVDLFDVTYRAHFVPEEPIKVYGMEQVSLVARPDTTIRYRTWYLDLGIRNDSPIDINMPHIDIPGEVIHVTEKLDMETKEFDRDIRLLHLRYENKYGYVQYLFQPPLTLAPGEAIFYEFVVYNVVDIDDELVLRDAFCDEMSGYQMNVVFEPKAKNHFSMLDAEKKFEALKDTNKEAFENLTLDYFYDSAAVSGVNEDNVIFKTVQDFDRSLWNVGNTVFNLDPGTFTHDQQKTIVKEILYEMLQSDGFEDNMQLKVDRTYMDSVKNALDAISEVCESPDDLASIMDSDNEIMQLADALKGGGTPAFNERLKQLIGATVFNQIRSKIDLDETMLGSLKENCEAFSTVFNYFIENAANAQDAAVLTVNTVLQMQAVKEQSMLLLSTIEDSLNANSTLWESIGIPSEGWLCKTDIEDIVRATVRELKAEINEQHQDLIEKFEKEFKKATAISVGQSVIGAAINKAVGEFSVYGVLKATFNLVDTIWQKSDEYKAIDELNIVTVVVNAVNLSIYNNTHNDTENKEINTMYLLKYLTIGRLLAEKYYHDLRIIQNNQDGGNAEKEKKIEEDYANSIEFIQRARDQIFGEIAEYPNIPARPVVTIDYDKMQTNELFDSRYEYNLNSGEWKTCTDGPIRFTLRTTKQLLHVRLKATDATVAGNITTVTLYTQNSLSKAITVDYAPGCYTVSGLNDSLTYEVLFTDSESVNLQTLDWSAAVTVSPAGKQGKVYSYVPREYAVIRSLRNDRLARANSLPLLLKVNNASNPSNILVDASTGIAVRSDTDFTENMRLNIRVVSSGSSVSALRAAFPAASGFSVYDISLTDGKTTVDPQKDLTVMIPMGADAEEQKTLLYYLKNEQNLLPITGKVLNSFMQFVTGHFSLYALVQFVPADFVASQSVSVTPKETEVLLGESVQLSFAVLPNNTTAKQVRWSSSDLSVVSVDDAGCIRAVGIGTATVSAITAEGDHTDTCAITVIPNTYTVTWNVDGAQTQESVRVGTTLKAPQVPEKEGYTFAGWNPAVPQTMPVGNQTFEAVYTKNTYTIIWKVDNRITRTKVLFGDKIVKLKDPTKEGHSFIEWTPAIPDTMPAKDLTFTATFSVNSYTVTWNIDGKTSTVSTMYGTTIEKPEDPSKEGYTFAGWYPVVPESMPANDLLFRAQFTPNTYDAVLMADGKQVAVIPYKTGQKSINLPDVPEKEGYTGMWPAYTLPIGGTTITAEYTINTYTIHWLIDGKLTDSTYTYGAEIQKPVNPSKEGYTFTGWTPTIPEIMPAKDLTCTAQFSVNSYTVTWIADGKTEQTTVKFGDPIKLPATPIKEGYVFKSWTPNVPKSMPAQDLTFTAVFDKIIVVIRNFTPNITVDYRATVSFTATVVNPIAGGQIHWYVDGKDVGTDETCTVKEAKATYTVQAKYVKDSKVLAESEIETVNVNTGFFARLKAFFRALFGRLPKVVQEHFGIEIIDRILP